MKQRRSTHLLLAGMMFMMLAPVQADVPEDIMNEIPEQPDAPDAPDVPDAPEAPDAPDAPDAPELPEDPCSDLVTSVEGILLGTGLPASIPADACEEPSETLIPDTLRSALLSTPVPGLGWGRKPSGQPRLP